MLKKISGMNYFVALMILLGIIIILGLTAFILVASFPGALGAAPPQYEIKEVYDFEPWSFELNGLSASYPEGGMIIPIFREDRQEAVLIIGEGDYSTGKQPLPVIEPLGLYLALSLDLFSEIRGDTIFMPVEDAAAKREALQIFEKQPGLPVQWQHGIPLIFYPGEAALYYYFLDSSGSAVLPPVIFEAKEKIYSTLALYVLFITMVLLVIYIFSLDHHPSRYWTFIHCARPSWMVAPIVLGAALFALLGELLPVLTGLPQETAALGYAAAAIGLILLARFKKIDFLDFGLRQDTVKNGYLMVFAAAVLFGVMTRGLPGKINLAGYATLIDFFRIFFLVALVREIIWRGFIQTTLGRLLGSTRGVIVTVIMAGLVNYLVLAVNTPWLLTYPYTAVELWILAPGTALVLGLIYLRTENIISSTLLHTLILFLPHIMSS